jgi:8-amino-7-oxononanoate synthase
MSLFTRWASALDTLKGQGRLRSFRLARGVDFTSNDYLGYGNGRLPIDPSTTLSVSGMSSRLLRGNHAIWEKVEARLAAWHGAEAVLMMTSGYAANEGLLSTILEPADWIATDELNHACIIDGLRLARCRRFSFKHNDLNQLENGLKAEAAKGEEGRERFVVTESLFSMDGDRSNLKDVVRLAEKYGAYVLIDEAHSTGCYGQTGSGCIDGAGVRSGVLASMHTGGKALGVPGAYLCVPKLLKEYLVNRCRHLIFTTALPAACGEWWLRALDRVQADGEGRARLHRNAGRFRERLASHGIAALGDTYVVPVVLGEDARAVEVATRLQADGFDVRAIRPPSVPPGTSRLRISVHADHAEEMLDALADRLRAVLNSASG